MPKVTSLRTRRMHWPGSQNSALTEHLASNLLCKQMTTDSQGTDLPEDESYDHPNYNTHRETKLTQCEPTPFNQQQK